ncbi:hypothetical protein TNCV_1147221 [Trichonephila clavipes]|nr:hypothetical protein TNCV_1147221 [Trichonephila clavipes]
MRCTGFNCTQVVRSFSCTQRWYYVDRTVLRVSRRFSTSFHSPCVFILAAPFGFYLTLQKYTAECCVKGTRNRWRDGQVCPDVRQGTMAPWARRLGGERKGRKESGGENGRKENGEETREDRRDGERKGLSPGLEWKDDERRWR